MDSGFKARGKAAEDEWIRKREAEKATSSTALKRPDTPKPPPAKQ